MANKSFYIDELGFYRYLDDDQMYFVCSNTNMAHIPRHEGGELDSRVKDNAIRHPNLRGVGIETCFKTVRHELGISHFDKIEDYQTWKNDWDQFLRAKLISRQPIFNNRQFKERIRSGIPHDYRCKVWTALIGMRTRNIRRQYPENIYELLVDQNQKQPLDSFKQIELDLLRTLPNNKYFEDPNSIGIQRVRRVLRAYSRFDPSVGYCQGMNRLAAMALLVLPEEEAFWCLVAIIQCIMPKDYYKKPWLAQVDCRVLSDSLERKLPKLHKHLVENDIEFTLFSWFFTIFVDGCRPELLMRIWDIFLYEGDKILFRFALAILCVAQDDLLKMSDFSSINNHLSRLVSTRKLDIETLFDKAFKAVNPISSQMLGQRREYHTKKLLKTIGVEEKKFQWT